MVHERYSTCKIWYMPDMVHDDMANRDFMSRKASWVVLVQESIVPLLRKTDKTADNVA